MNPLKSRANATLLFTLPTGVEVVGALGNTERTADALVAIAWFKQSAASPSQSPGNDIDEGVLRLEGRLIVPNVLPSSIVPGQSAKAILWHIGCDFRLPNSFDDQAEYDAFVTANEAHIAQRGDFYLSASVPNAMGVDRLLGAKIQGRLVMQTVWGEVI